MMATHRTTTAAARSVRSSVGGTAKEAPNASNVRRMLIACGARPPLPFPASIPSPFFPRSPREKTRHFRAGDPRCRAIAAVASLRFLRAVAVR